MRARARFVFSPRRAKNAAYCLRCGQEFFGGKKFRVEFGLVGHGAQTAADVGFKSAFAVFDARDHAHVVHAGQTACFLGASGKGDLEFAAKVLAVGVPEKELGEGMRIRRDHRMFRCDTRPKARQAVTLRMELPHASRGGNAHGGEAAHEVGGVFDVYVVDLNILARGDVQYAVRIFFGYVGQYLHLIGGQAAIRDFDALHTRRIPDRVWPLEKVAAGVLEWFGYLAVKALSIVVALAVNTAAKAGFGKDAVVNLSLFFLFDLRFKCIDFST